MDVQKKFEEIINDSINDSIKKSLLNETQDENIELIKQFGYSSSESQIGYVIQLGDKFWGVKYFDERSTDYGWVELNKAMIYDYYPKESDINHKSAKIISVEKQKIIHIDLNYGDKKN